MSDITELIIITNKDLTIASVNEAVVKHVQLSKTELLHKHIFKTIFLKNTSGHFITEESIGYNDFLQTKTARTIADLHLLTKNGMNGNLFTLTMKPILDLEGNLDQIIFILNESNRSSQVFQNENLALNRVITTQGAIIEEIKVKLAERGQKDLEFKAAFVGKIEREVRNLLELRTNTADTTTVAVNIARICKTTCDAMTRFAHFLHVSLQCELLNVGKENMQDIVLADSNLSIDDLTRSLYTARVNLKWFDILLHKLIEIAIMLASSSEKRQVVVTVEKKASFIDVHIISSFTNMNSTNKDDLFSLQYGSLPTKTNLIHASGLEGYIARQISERYGLPVVVDITDGGFSFKVTIDSGD